MVLKPDGKCEYLNTGAKPVNGKRVLNPSRIPDLCTKIYSSKCYMMQSKTDGNKAIYYVNNTKFKHFIVTVLSLVRYSDFLCFVL